jgi:hypothetical protein
VVKTQFFLTKLRVPGAWDVSARPSSPQDVHAPHLLAMPSPVAG